MKTKSKKILTFNIHKFKTDKGFTLIEFLIVIAIIGILTSIITTSLKSAKEKALNMSIKSSMSSLRSQAEIYYDDNFQSYGNICIGDSKFTSILGAATNTGGGPTTTISTYCNSDENSWSAYTQLKATEDENNYWCANNTGLSQVIITIPDPWATSSCQ